VLRKGSDLQQTELGQFMKSLCGRQRSKVVI
jgi:hypothetical protein